MRKTYVAIDLGSSNVRIFNCYLDKGVFCINDSGKLLHEPMKYKNTLAWKHKKIEEFIVESLRNLGKSKEFDIQSISVDSWGVDFTIVNKDGEVEEKPISYRSPSCYEHAEEYLSKHLSKQELFKKTGISHMDINTVFQMYTRKKNNPEISKAGNRMLLTGDYFNFLLTGEKLSEISLASTSQMVNLETINWDRDILNSLDIDDSFVPEIVDNGVKTLKLSKNIKEVTGLNNTNVLIASSHDTAAAITSLPLTERDCYLATGSWGMIGSLTEKPFISEEAYKLGISNERVSKKHYMPVINMMGFWIFQELYRDFGKKFTYDDLVARAYADYGDKITNIKLSKSMINPEYKSFASMGNICKKINDYLQKTKQATLTEPEDFTRCIIDSLLVYYAIKIREFEAVTNSCFESIYLTGGGVKNRYFCQILAEMTEKIIFAEGVESAIAGNVFSQMSVNENIDIQTIKKYIEPFRKRYKPTGIYSNNEARSVYDKLIERR